MLAARIQDGCPFMPCIHDWDRRLHDVLKILADLACDGPDKSAYLANAISAITLSA